jgi:hypothetical protein
MKKIIAAALLIVASVSAHAQFGNLCALTQTCPDQVAAAKERQVVAQQKVAEQQAEQVSVQRSIDADQAAYNSPQQQAMRAQSAAVLADQRGPAECSGEKFREAWQAVYSTKMEYENDAQAADDPRYASNPSFQARERKAAAQEQKDYERLKGKAMAVCHS